MVISVKICGLTTTGSVGASVAYGARFVGFVFFRRSPRWIEPRQAADLATLVPAGIGKVGLVVDATDDELAAICDLVPLDAIQLHGRESPERVHDIRARLRLPVVKAIGVATAEDLARARAYEQVADRLLFDARPPAGATRPGGNAQRFDWSLLAGEGWRVPWFLAGGLTMDNVELALRASGARSVDVSSGVEVNGQKDPALIRGFLARVRELAETSSVLGNMNPRPDERCGADWHHRHSVA